MYKEYKITFVMPWHISERGGGAEVQANYLAQELSNRGIVVSYICQSNQLNKIDTVEILGSISIYWLKPSGKFQWLDQNKYLKQLKLIEPDVVVQRLTSNVSYVIGKYTTKYNSKFIWICTDNKNPFKNYHLAKFKERISIKSIGLLKYMLFYSSNWFMDYFRNLGMKNVDIAFTQNDYQRKKLKENYNRDSYRMISGHPLPEYKISKSERFLKKTILWCANFGKHKRPELFIELAKKLKDENYKLIMVGGHSDKSYVDNLLLEKSDNLIVTGTLSFEEALNYFDQASIFVNTSAQGGDGFPNTFIQAWLRNIPVVSLGFDPDNVIHDNNLGYVAKNTNDACHFIKKTLSEFDDYELLSSKVHQYGKKYHTIEIMTSNFINALKSQ